MVLRPAKVRRLMPLMRTVDTRTTPLPPKQVNPVYLSAEFKAWRAAVVGRAGGRCEAKDQHGMRCTRAWPEHRVYADHIRELYDGGSLLDLNNGQCLCASHHKIKTDQARASRIKC